MANSGDKRNPNSNKGRTVVYNRKESKKLSIRVEADKLAEFSKIAKSKGLNMQLMIEKYIDQIIEETEGE